MNSREAWASRANLLGIAAVVAPWLVVVLIGLGVGPLGELALDGAALLTIVALALAFATIVASGLGRSKRGALLAALALVSLTLSFVASVLIVRASMHGTLFTEGRSPAHAPAHASDRRDPLRAPASPRRRRALDRG